MYFNSVGTRNKDISFHDNKEEQRIIVFKENDVH